MSQWQFLFPSFLSSLGKVGWVFISIDCKTVGFFLKISKEIGKAWRLSPVSLSVFSLIPDLLFDCSRVLEYAKIRTVLQSIISTNVN